MQSEEEVEGMSDSMSDSSTEDESSDEEAMTVCGDVLRLSHHTAAPLRGTSTTQDDDQKVPGLSQNTTTCHKCQGDAITVQYHCQTCTSKRSTIRSRCYASGSRCVSGDRQHDTSVSMRVLCFKMNVSARSRALRTYVSMRTRQSEVLLRFAKEKPEFLTEIENEVTVAAQKM
jgi:hypothetical protein